MAEGRTPSRKRAFDVAFKLKVVDAAESTNNKAAQGSFQLMKQMFVIGESRSMHSKLHQKEGVFKVVTGRQNFQTWKNS